jgi:crossover junction endodeoxyribonuclease RuvC
MSSSERVLAIDPGYERMGIAILEKQNRKEVVLFSDCVKTKTSMPHSGRLALLSVAIETCVKEWKPDVCATESLFFGKNRKTAILVAEARGAILSTVARLNLPVSEYFPMEVKIAVTGHGGSDKKQVEFMLKKLVNIEKKIEHDDEYDAIAIGLTHLISRKKAV